jgi:NAD(P)-dependent dehydrogenase (short-subunit alcohol dehydrogenase family)
LCDGRVVVVTGAGRGIGRSHALAFAAEGARVVVNDLGGEVDGSGSSSGPAGEVVESIRTMGGEAVADGNDVSDRDGAARIVAGAIDAFGRLDVVVNNAGILRDRMLVNMTDDEWDDVIRVHLRGTYAPCRAAAAYWREEVKAGRSVDARIINTSSASGLFGNPGQTNYGAAKAGIAAFTVIAAKELERYGVTVNAIAPGARTRMTAPLGFGSDADADASAFDASAPENISPVVVWLGSSESSSVTGRVFEVMGGRVGVVEGWRRGPSADKADRWAPSELGPVVSELVRTAAPPEAMFPG